MAERIWHDPNNWLWRDGHVEPGPTVVFDMDGVLSDASTRQYMIERPYGDWDSFFEACGEDEVISDVARMLECMESDLRIVMLTARPLRVQPQTYRWLERHGLRWDLLIMRDWGDYMRAAVFKQITVGELRAYGFELRLAFEDDPRNVKMFQHEGVPCVYIHSGYH